MDIWRYAGLAILSYLLGSIPSGVISARAFRRTDVRSIGSGHTGAINTYRAAGFQPAVLTLLADGAKGVLAISLVRQWGGAGWAIPLAATLVVVGHCYPIFTRFRGGMGLSTAGGVLLALQPLACISLIIVWFPIWWLFSRVSSANSSFLGFAARREASTFASLAVALLLPVTIPLFSSDPFTRLAGVGVGGVLFLRHLKVVMLRRRTILSARERGTSWH